MNIYPMIVQAHGALRLSFHDAIGISPTLGYFAFALVLSHY